MVLSGQVESTLHGELVAQAITRTITSARVRRLEDGPFGGTRICLGDTAQAEAVDCPLPQEGAWQMVGVKDIGLGQTADQLSRGRLWVEGMSATNPIRIPICSIEDSIERIGPHDLDITGSQIKPDGLPQGPFELIAVASRTAAYPCLWNHHTSRERRLIVEPDSHCRIRDVGGRVPAALSERAEERWATAARAHYNRDLQFNSQSLLVAITEERSIGGRAWPSVVFNEPSHEFVFSLWCNSTLGLLCHWWTSNKTQSGRGTTTIMSIPFIPTLDVRNFSSHQHEAARVEFDRLARERFLPFDQIDADPARSELDRALLIRVLGLDPALCDVGGPLELLRRKLAAEPQIHADKRTRLVFNGSEEMSVPR